MTNNLPSIEDLLKKQAEQNGAAPAQNQKTDQDTETTERLTEKLGTIELQSREKEAQLAAGALGVQYVDLKGFPISPDALSQIPMNRAKELQAICFLFTGPELRVGAVDPGDESVKELLFQLEERNKTKGVIYKISAESFEQAFKLYATLPKIRKVTSGVELDEKVLAGYEEKIQSFADIASAVKESSVTDLITVVIASALKIGTSDIHIEAEETGIALRFRVDGILQEVTTIEKSEWNKIINRIKLVAGLKINITDRPQDGRFTIHHSGQKVDVRTSTLPTAWGESVVMRILNPDSINLEFQKLGFREASLARLTKEIVKPHGMIVTTGPTGSGKTTTLYAILSYLNKPGVKIITLEDPIEYKVEGLNQSQIDATKEYTFAKGLRSILRQDPDIVMVGEIRDLETAETAIQAALTGHMMVSTIHTNDAAGAIPRFTSMGVKPFLLAPAINAIMGQRLARKVCESCKEETQIDEATLAKVKELLSAIPENSGEAAPDMDALTFYKGAGCAECNNTGYKGRIGLYEILIKDAEIEKFILSGEISEYAVREVAAKQGMLTMAQDGLLKALEGLTSVEEIQRVTGL